MPAAIYFQQTVSQRQAEIELPLSKSICNRVLMLSAWSGGLIRPDRISDAADSRLLAELIQSENLSVYDARDAGTAFRFLAAWLGISGKSCLLTGTDRMKERPVAELVDALHQMGCRIDFEEKEGFPPLRFRGFHYSGKNELHMGLKTSSQFVSALMMAAPVLPDGMHIHLEQGGGSFPYLELTAGVMRECGLEVKLSREQIEIPPQSFRDALVKIEADWSSAAAFYGILSLLPEGSSFVFPGLRLNSLQGDRVLASMSVFRTVRTEETERGIKITRLQDVPIHEEICFDFRDCPDLALAVISTCAAAGIAGKFSGLASLQIKESKRLNALQSELRKIGVNLQIRKDGSEASLPGGVLRWPEEMPEFDCHNDHRIAMALSILLFSAPGRKAVFRQPEVVEKSFPGFWKEVQKLGLFSA